MNYKIQWQPAEILRIRLIIKLETDKINQHLFKLEATWMDLIAEIIKRKNYTPTDALDIIKQLITDIITYEKLLYK